MATPNLTTRIWLALRTKVEALSLTPALPILWPSEGANLPEGNCLEVTNFVNRPGGRLIKGSLPHERLGILQVSLLSPSSTASHRETVLREIAGDVADHFVVDEPLRYGATTVRVYEAPDVGGTFSDEDRARMVTPVSIRWRCYA